MWVYGVSGAGTLVSQNEIHRMVQSENWSERREAAKLLGSNFEFLPDKEQAWNDMHWLTLDKGIDVRVDAALAIGIAFPNIPNKKQAWKDIHRLTQIKEEYVREYAALALGYAFPHLPDKKQAWNDLQRLAQDEQPEVLESAAMSLKAAFSDISDKEQAWEYLVWLAQYDDYDVQISAIDALGDVYSDFIYKEQAWEDIFWLTEDEGYFGRWRAVYALGVAFPHNPNKRGAWEDIHQLIQYNDKGIRGSSADVLGNIFYLIPDKEQAWLDLHRLAKDQDNYVREKAALALGFAFLHIPDKKQAWEDLHRLTEDLNEHVLYSVAIALGSAFTHLSDKEQAWKDIIKLTTDKTSYVQGAAVITLGIIFSQVSDKKLTWNILHLMTKYAHDASAVAIGLAFPYVPNKKQAWNDLIRLAQNKDKDVRGSANYSLGRASIFKATEAESENGFRKELEKALGFFEKSLNETTYRNPASFCLPFYRSFYTITFQKQDAAIEVQKYLVEAKNALEGSESAEKLLEVVESLKNALDEAQKTNDFNNMKSDLNAYRRYLERAADLLADTEEKAPDATKLIRRGLPIIDEKIREIIAEIQENAKALCKQTKDTLLEDLGKEVIRLSQAFPQIRDPIGLEKGFINLWTALSSICAKMPEDERGEACELLKKANEEHYIEDKLPLINMVLSKISSQISAAKNIETVEKKLDEIMFSLKPGIREELVITAGAELAGTGAKHEIRIPLQEITYPEIKSDLEKIKGRTIFRLGSLPTKLAEKVKGYLLRTKKGELLKQLT